MENLILSLVTFGLVYLIYLFLIVLRKNKMAKYKNSTEVKYLKSKYKININKVNLKKLAHILALANAFIIALTIFVTGFVNDFVLKLMVGFVVLFPMILIVYHLIGINLAKKYKKE